MTIKLLNLFDTSLLVLPYASTPKLLDPVTCITIIIFNTTIEYLVLYGLIVLALQVNLLRNLVYRVMNLGILSIFAIALWAVLTGPNFVYIVYILAFVGAVIMLFLSVILMLPSSAITPPVRIAGLLAMHSVPGNSDIVSSSLSLGGALKLILVLITILALSYLCLVLIYSRERRVARGTLKESMIHVTLGYGPEWHLKDHKGVSPDQKASAHLAFAQYAVTHSLFAYASEEQNKHMIQHCRANLRIISAGNCGHIFLASEGEGGLLVRSMSPLFLLARPKLGSGLYYTPGRANSITSLFIAVIYEFAEYYIRAIEPIFMTVKASRFNPFVQLTYPVRRLVGARH